YTLTASATGLAGATSNAFNVNVGPATQLVFATSPSSATAGSFFGTQPVVVVADTGGNTVGRAANSITLAVGNNAGGGTLSGTKTLAASGGVSSFSGLSIDKAGTGYTLTASASGLAGATSAAFNITAGAPSKVVFSTQPASATGGAVFGMQPVVTV